MNEQTQEKYLPIGTVVMLKGGEKRLMITGFCIVTEENKNKVYDYLGCAYPEGIFNPKQGFMFDHNQIDKIYHMGLIDDEEKNFKVKLKEALEKSNNIDNTNNTTPIPVLSKLEDE